MIALQVRLLLLFVASWFLVAVARANDAGINEGAYGPQPIDLAAEGESPVRMVAEALWIRYGRKQADVAIDFWFENTSATPLRQKIGFPDVRLAMTRDRSIEGAFPNPGAPLRNLRTWINGAERPDTVEYGKIRRDANGVWLPPKEGARLLTMAWHTATVDFPPGEIVTVRRAYSAHHGYYPFWLAVFFYYTLTGAQWQGTIGQMELTVELTDGLRVSDLEWSPSSSNPYKIAMSPPRAKWQILSPTRLKLTWKDFEPATQKDRQWFRLVARDRQMSEQFYRDMREEFGSE